MHPRHILLPLPARTPAEPLARAWLASQWQVDAAALPLQRDTRGRPRLAPPLEAFDAGWSHSGGRLLVACGEGITLGCDLEQVRPRPNARALARRFFHAEESAWLAALPDPEVEVAFLRLWCAKEAVLKAHGHGLSFGLEKLRFEERAGALQVADCDPRLGQAQDWRLQEFSPAPGFVAAIAWRARRAQQR